MIEPRQDVSQSEIQDRREYWTSYAEEQGKLFERQYKLENDLRTARQNLAKIPGTQRNRIRPRFIDSGWKFIVAGRKACWYLAVQTFELAQIRNMVPPAERRYLFDESNVNTNILAPALPTDISHDEICGICQESMHDQEINKPNGLRRTFCGHFYHHDCIVRWFNQAGELNVTCPICRQRRSLVRPPLGEWEIPRGFDD